MNTIVHQIIEKIISGSNENLESLFKKDKDISTYILNTKEMLNEIGTDLVKMALEMADEIVKESSGRKENWYVQRKDDEKVLLTLFGEVNYKRTYYKHKYNKEYSYLSDEILCLSPHERMDASLEAELITKATDLSYEKSGKRSATNLRISKQTVMNSIRNLGTLDYDALIPTTNLKDQKKVKIIYIEADEDHVAMQDGSNKQVRLIYVHEGRKKVNSGRYQLINPYYFTKGDGSSEEFWLEVADYLNQVYDLDYTQTIYLSGDGARWIKEGLSWIKGSRYVLDYFHLSKYVRKATAHLTDMDHELWCSIHELDQAGVKEVFVDILKNTEQETKIKSIKECRRYILNNWEGIVNRYDADYIGCSAEGHISHLLSARLSSRPLGWSPVGANQMASLRVYQANGGNIYNALKDKKEATKKANRIIKLDQRVVKNKYKGPDLGAYNNLTILNTGRRTWAYEFLKSIRGA